MKTYRMKIRLQRRQKKEMTSFGRGAGREHADVLFLVEVQALLREGGEVAVARLGEEVRE